MIERRVSVWVVASVLLWLLSVATIAASFVWPVASAGLLLAVAAMTVTVRHWMGRQWDMTHAQFRLLRDAGRAEGGSLHGVR